jgi:hypothetical protein
MGFCFAYWRKYLIGLQLKSGDLNYGLILIDSIALPFKAGIVMITHITIRTLVTFVQLSGLIMSSFQDFIFFVYDFVTIISSLRDLLSRRFLRRMNQGS